MLGLLLGLAGCVPDLGAAKKTLRAAIEEKEDDLGECYADGLARDKEAKGGMELVLHVADGRVASVKVNATDLADGGLEKCVKKTLAKVKVAAPAEFDIDYTLQFGEATDEDKSDERRTRSSAAGDAKVDDKPAKKKKPTSEDE